MNDRQFVPRELSGVAGCARISGEQVERWTSGEFHYRPVQILMLIITLWLFCPATATAETQTNVLHIIIDDLRPVLGCYGDPIAKTPAIDRLAAKGVLFDRAYVQHPICGPSRASFLSGLRPQTRGYFDWKYPPKVTLMPTWFRQNGYFTAAFGKVFHQGHVFNNPDEKTTDGIVARRAVAAMERAVHAGKPFYIAAGMRRPHQVLMACKRDFDFYPLKSVPALPAEPRDY